MDCLLCSETNLKKSYGYFFGNIENPSFVCRNCAECVNCESTAEDIDNYDDTDDDENKYISENDKENENEEDSNWLSDEWSLINIKRPYFNFGGWAFMSEEELSKHYKDSKGLLCEECQLYTCNKCVKPKMNQHRVKMFGICSNPCKKCDDSCDRDNCECVCKHEEC
jgi:hypothetical protein